VKGLVVSLLIVLGLVVAADRVGLSLTERAVASQMQTSGSLSTRPDVSIRGFPFLTQALSGRYGDIEVSASDVTAGGGRLTRLTASLSGVHVPLSSALSGSVNAVPVEAVKATVLLSYADIDRQLRDRNLSVSAAGSSLRVTGSVTVLGRKLSASAVSSVALAGTSVRVTAQRYEVGSAAASRAVTGVLAGRFDFLVRIGRLPYGLTLQDVRVSPEGIVATASGRDTVLRR
jgi:hypothetical protein